MGYPQLRPGLSTGIALGDHGIKTKTADYSMVTDDEYILADGTSATVDVTLPPPSGATNRIYTIKAINVTMTVRVLPNASETIDGAASVTLGTQWDAITVITDGTNWFIVQNKG